MKESPALEVVQHRAAELEKQKQEGWEVVHSLHRQHQDPQLQELVNQRNLAWKKVHEVKKIVKKYTSQLHDTETFIKNENADAFKNKEIVEKLEQTKKVIEKALVKAREDVALAEEEAKEISHKIVAAQGRLRQQEEQVA